jgi:hypothetical protein
MNRQERKGRAKIAKKESEINYKRMMRAVKLSTAADSLTASELETAMTQTKVLQYVETKLDENGVPVDGDTKELKLSNIDIRRLERVLISKQENEKQAKSITL